MQQIGIDKFLAMATEHPVLDVRSPAEYEHAHIPGAHNLPLFTDAERKVVGTEYKQLSREQAIKTGLDYFGPKMSGLIVATENILSQYVCANSKIILLHCARGGMRSAGMAWLLDLYGFKVYSLSGGYKAYRNWALRQFVEPCSLQVIGGYTGAGKTQILHELHKEGHAVIDLEGIAKHKGSAFGGLGEQPQPSQEMFENLLADRLYTISGSFPRHNPIWIEDESQRIGHVNIPGAFYNAKSKACLWFIDVPFEDRLNNIIEQYGAFPKQDLANAITRIQKKLGGLNTKNALWFLENNDYKECFRILLRYYDKYYARALYDRDAINNMMHTIVCRNCNAATNTAELITKYITNGNTNTGN